jgi:hypothetical protein
MSFRTGFTSSSKAFAGLSFNIRLTYLETSWNKLEAIGKSVLETTSEAWTIEGSRKSVELETKSAEQLCMSRGFCDHHISSSFLKNLLNEINGKLFIYHHQKTMNIEINRRKLNCRNVQNVEPKSQNQRNRGKWRVALTKQEREWSLRLGFTNAQSATSNSAKC